MVDGDANKCGHDSGLIRPVGELTTGRGGLRRPGPPSSGEAVGVDAVQDDVGVFVIGDLPRSGEPPFRVLLQQLCGSAAFFGIFRSTIQLAVAPEHENRGPVVFVLDVVDLDTNGRILAHPLDLLPDARKRVDATALRLEGEVDRNDVRLVQMRAGEPAERPVAQEVDTLFDTQRVDPHCAPETKAAVRSTGTVRCRVYTIRKRRFDSLLPLR